MGRSLSHPSYYMRYHPGPWKQGITVAVVHVKKIRKGLVRPIGVVELGLLGSAMIFRGIHTYGASNSALFFPDHRTLFVHPLSEWYRWNGGHEVQSTKKSKKHYLQHVQWKLSVGWVFIRKFEYCAAV